ncbi:tyrosine-type recombinase/integrase [Pseudarthrobacter cellobiosi]|uniref:tyrosine-type recombinase/integrase n=1 Tax=Pseudarthrobacter cellobiosi TaxID=2953654 RepID=UPI00208E770F|nr:MULTISPECIES: tyrosine-type recombinase/integrase [unclassified Pseudarthrobacter]MCO4255566.1 tyrosine-type recombinase/integrase [Pseudarthrobacter sp. HLT1-5]MCO4273618.1 tyrosine-type recombinase/integrase [Pseudarthrobacter sp. HLT3-5]
MAYDSHARLGGALSGVLSTSSRFSQLGLLDRKPEHEPVSKEPPCPWNPGTAAGLIQVWQTTIGLHDEQGHPFRFTAHQLRHTYARHDSSTPPPQEVVRRLLDHESHEMTARYARLMDETVRRHWEKATKINIRGETISPGQDNGLNSSQKPKQQARHAWSK